MIIFGQKFGIDEQKFEIFNQKFFFFMRLFVENIAIFDQKLNSLTIWHYTKVQFSIRKYHFWLKMNYLQSNRLQFR